MLVCPWGIAPLSAARPVDLGRDETFSDLARQLEAYDNISRRHARVELRPDGVYVTDFGSTNGTFLEGRRLTPNTPQLAGPGATVRLASNVEMRISGERRERGAA
jgi:pSer/pThr/pTyr-binding forkhead associated (FHA) protein